MYPTRIQRPLAVGAVAVLSSTLFIAFNPDHGPSPTLAPAAPALKTTRSASILVGSRPTYEETMGTSSWRIRESSKRRAPLRTEMGSPSSQQKYEKTMVSVVFQSFIPTLSRRSRRTACRGPCYPIGHEYFGDQSTSHDQMRGILLTHKPAPQSHTTIQFIPCIT